MAIEISEALRKFKWVKTLQAIANNKSIILQGTIDNQDALVFVEKLVFQLNHGFFNLNHLYDAAATEANDVYTWGTACLRQSPSEPGVKVNIIYPATPQHIRKFTLSKHHAVEESEAMFEAVVRPFIQTQLGDRIQWVRNILFHGAEAEAVLYRDSDPETGFVVLPDMKWDRKLVLEMYLQVIANRDVTCVRDLRALDVPFLRKMKAKIVEVAEKEFHVKPDELRIFVHYQPSYYHFHVHAVHINYTGNGVAINIGKAILLDDVIENLQLLLEYYKHKTMHYTIFEMHPLWAVVSEYAKGEARLEA